MSYKTNAKSLRLGISHSWSYKAHGSLNEMHIDHKVKSYLRNLIEYVVPQAPKKSNTRAKKEKNLPIQPGLQGKTIVLRTHSKISVVCFYYLNYDGASPKQVNDFHKNISMLKHTINNETGCKLELKMINYFIFFWRYEAFLGLNSTPGIRKQVGKCVSSFKHLKTEREYYSNIRKLIGPIKRSVIRFRRQRYFRRTFYPFISSFLFGDFDSELAAKVIALELQMLRIEHKRFVYYLQRFFKMSFKVWNKKYKMINGLQIKINGRMTDYRRQVRRTQTKIINIGVIKRSDIANEAGHSMAIAYNRYGSISVQVSYQLAPLVAEHWDERSPINPQLIFSTKAFTEICANFWDFKKKNQHQSKPGGSSLINFEDKIENKLSEVATINKKYLQFKKNQLIKKEEAINKTFSTKLSLFYVDNVNHLENPFKVWNAKESFNRYISKFYKSKLKHNKILLFFTKCQCFIHQKNLNLFVFIKTPKLVLLRKN